MTGMIVAPRAILKLDFDFIEDGCAMEVDLLQHLMEKIAYLKGMAEGMHLQNKTEEGRLLVEMLDLLDDLVFELERSLDRQEELHDYVDAIDEDLTDVESMVYDDEWLADETADSGDRTHRADASEKGEEETYYM